MKFIINEKEYDPIGGLKHVSLQTLYVLKVKNGVGIKALQATAQKMDGLTDAADVMDDPEMLQALMVIVWLARRYAGEKITLEQANDDFGLGDLLIEHEDGDDEVIEPAPKAPVRTGSGAAKKHKRKIP